MTVERIPPLAHDETFMRRALTLARKGLLLGEVPVGALVVSKYGEILAEAHNSPITLNDPTAHAEVLAIRRASKKIGNYRLGGTTLYVTLEPCVMCMGAIIQARMDRLVFGAFDPKAGAAASIYNLGEDGKLNHRVRIAKGVLAEEASRLLTEFFQGLRGQD